VIKIRSHFSRSGAIDAARSSKLYGKRLLSRMSLVNQSIIKNKVGLVNLAEELRNVSQACRMMGVLRDTFYRVKEACEQYGTPAR
jgi:hypothetical protein